MGLSEGVGGLSSGLMLGRVILGWLGGSGSRSIKGVLQVPGPSEVTEPSEDSNVGNPRAASQWELLRQVGLPTTLEIQSTD